MTGQMVRLSDAGQMTPAQQKKKRNCCWNFPSRVSPCKRTNESKNLSQTDTLKFWSHLIDTWNYSWLGDSKKLLRCCKSLHWLLQLQFNSIGYMGRLIYTKNEIIQDQSKSLTKTILKAKLFFSFVSEAVVRRCSIKKTFLKNSHEFTGKSFCYYS